MDVSLRRWVIEGLLLALACAACGTPQRQCSSANCTGCCGMDGVCLAGNTVNACGNNGTACQSCSAGQTCFVSGCFSSDSGQGGGGAGGGGADVNGELEAIRLAADTDAGQVSLPIDGALVTYLKPLVVDAGASDPAGFFVQSSQQGPALFVAIDATQIAGGPLAVGDNVSFVVTALTKNGGVRTATAVSSLVKSSSGSPVTGLNQAASAVDFGAPGAIDDYESELITTSGTVVANSSSAGSGFRGIPFSTTGSPSAADGGFVVQLRLPWALANQEDLTPGCTATLGPTPMWRFNARAQPSAFAASEVQQVSCPAPKVSFARATAPTAVLVGFDRNVQSTSVSAGDFTIAGAGALNVSAATMTTSRQVTLTTDAQTPGAQYSVSITGILDTRGTSIDSAAATAMFVGYSAPDGGMDGGSNGTDAGVPDAGTTDAGSSDAGTCTLTYVVISQVKSRGAGGASDEFVELYNPTDAGVTLDSTWSLTVRSSASSSYSPRWSGTGQVMPARGHLLIGGSAYAGSVTVDGTLSSGITDEGSLVLSHNGTGVDALCYAFPNDAGMLFVFDSSYTCEGLPANNQPHDNTIAGMSNSDVSLERRPGLMLGNCIDTNSNAADFTSLPAAVPHDLASSPTP
jgi:hypothetical protein